MRIVKALGVVLLWIVALPLYAACALGMVLCILLSMWEERRGR